MRFWQVATALICLLVGYKTDPFHTRQAFRKPSAVQITQSIAKIESYIEVGNLEGARALLKSLKKVDPQNQAVGILEGRLKEARPVKAPQGIDRLPASLRDRYYDSFILAKKGHCQPAHQAFVPIEKYLHDAKSLIGTIEALCPVTDAAVAPGSK